MSRYVGVVTLFVQLVPEVAAECWRDLTLFLSARKART